MAGVANSGCLPLFLTPPLFLFAVLGFEPWDSQMPGRLSTTEPCPWPLADGFQASALPVTYAEACLLFLRP